MNASIKRAAPLTRFLRASLASALVSVMPGNKLMTALGMSTSRERSGRARVHAHTSRAATNEARNSTRNRIPGRLPATHVMSPTTAPMPAAIHISAKRPRKRSRRRPRGSRSRR